MGKAPQDRAAVASRIDNRLTTFAYDWYARFDKATPMEGLLPNLPDEMVEFIYP